MPIGDKTIDDLLQYGQNFTKNGKRITHSEIFKHPNELCLEQIAKRIHYPDCWDTMAYPTIFHAMDEMAGCVGCSECSAGKNPDADQRPTGPNVITAPNTFPALPTYTRLKDSPAYKVGYEDGLRERKSDVDEEEYVRMLSKSATDVKSHGEDYRSLKQRGYKIYRTEDGK